MPFVCFVTLVQKAYLSAKIAPVPRYTETDWFLPATYLAGVCSFCFRSEFIDLSKLPDTFALWIN